MKTVEFQFDFGSPNAYLAHRIIPQIEARTGATFVYTPVLLGGLFKLTNNQSPMMAFAGIPNKVAYENLEMRRFITRHNIPFQMNPHFPVNTLLLMRMATAAAMDGGLPEYLEAAYRLMWETPKKMDDPQIVATELTAAGIDAERLMKRAQEDEVKQRLMATTEAAAKRGAFGSPTFFVGDDIYFGKNTLREIEDRLAG
ncbi:putative 2-hydroxychromene-2-carboxylate isomerase [Hyphomonas neptunium ATCC 15444]|uniref:2-hydroxychromene-2-carboxylate isomerase n=2 Tax=Hyphomonas TaxID=85 RepID=Q0BZP4_HYPNA|nr:MULTISPECIES: 2-hydroxychromene-2-carboxylate isomerase [Hyphomonas]ABI77416.1 putative 2-hydroxychromene-2-carboxylate isomerase [Hyphomonas neptunium ATCC 15444]KCZ86748.1 putative 2-hydroxychromene-2-carboxylate isomerase [Hyphomonas hirschiana VP5]